jgi:hypothetical protein
MKARWIKLGNYGTMNICLDYPHCDHEYHYEYVKNKKVKRGEE